MMMLTFIMKRLKLGNKTLNIKSDSLQRLIDSALSSPHLTRSAIAKSASVSLATAGKLLSALDECAFTELKYKIDDGASYPSKLHVFRREISILVLDFSSYKYSATIVYGKGEKASCFSHTPDQNLSFEGNATVFLSKIGKELSLLPYCPISICTIVADDPQNMVKTASTPSSYLPQAKDMAIVNDICIRFFATIPALCLTYSQAIKCALKYDIFQLTIRDKSVSHIRLSDTLEATHLPSHSSPAPIKLNKLIINGKRFPSAWERAQDVDEAAYLLAHVISLIDCTHDNGFILMEYDSNRFGGIEERIDHIFKATNTPLPAIAYYDLKPQGATLGAAAAALSALIAFKIKGA